MSDSDAERYIKIFTSLEREEIEALVAEHQQAPHLRLLQKRLAKEVTCMVHSEEDYQAAVDASEILFGKATADRLRSIPEDILLQVFDGVPQRHIGRSRLEEGVPVLDFLAVETDVFPSKGEARKMIQGNGLSINKEKVTDPNAVISTERLLQGKYVLVQKGKKDYFLVIAD